MIVRRGAIMNEGATSGKAKRKLNSENHATQREKRKKTARIAGVIVFNVISILLLARVLSIPTRNLIASLEIVGLVLLPLVLFYARSNWSRKLCIPYAVVLPLLWFCTYGVLHELSH